MEVLNNVVAAYEAVKSNQISQGLIWLCTFIAILIVINKFITAYKEAFSDNDKPVSIKHFFDLFYIYIYVLGIILLAPVAFNIIEKVLGELQNDLISFYEKDIDLSIDEAIATFTTDYIDDMQRRNDWIGKQIDEIIMLPINIALYTLLLYGIKYIFFFFAAARYYYLILLEIVTPLAVVFSLSETTRHYTHAYLKNLFVCYMLLPAFIIAQVFGNIISSGVMDMLGQNKYGLLGLLFTFIFELFLFAKAPKYVEKLIS